MNIYLIVTIQILLKRINYLGKLKMDYEIIKNEFYQKGWCKVPNFFQQDFINIIKEELDNFIEVNTDNYNVGEIHFTEDADRSAPKINTIHVLSYKSKFFN